MRKAPMVLAGCLVVSLCGLAACGKNEQAGVRVKVLLGATTLVAAGDQPIVDSIIVIAGSKIRAVGMRKDVPVPQNSDRTDLSGRWLVPAPGSMIKPGETANLMILKAEPKGSTPAQPTDISSQIVGGDWKL